MRPYLASAECPAHSSPWPEEGPIRSGACSAFLRRRRRSRNADEFQLLDAHDGRGGSQFSRSNFLDGLRYLSSAVLSAVGTFLSLCWGHAAIPKMRQKTHATAKARFAGIEQNAKLPSISNYRHQFLRDSSQTRCRKCATRFFNLTAHFVDSPAKSHPIKVNV